MIHLFGSKFQTGANVIRFKKGIVFEDLLLADTRGEHIQDVLDANAIMADAWPPAALLRIECDSVGMFHWLNVFPLAGYSNKDLNLKIRPCLEKEPLNRQNAGGGNCELRVANPQISQMTQNFLTANPR
jgi:hypothetical protein